MIKLRINEKEVCAHGSIVTLHIYRQEFNRDLLSDCDKAIYDEETLLFTKIVWAMIKTVNHKTESYIQWFYTVDTNELKKQLDLIIYEINMNLMFDIQQKSTAKSSTKKIANIELGLIKNIIDLRISLDIVNLLSVQSFLELQELYLDRSEDETVMATPKQVSAFFVG